MSYDDFQYALIRRDIPAVHALLRQDPSLARRPRARDGYEPIDYLWSSDILMQDHDAAIAECVRLLMEYGATPNTGRCVHELLLHYSRASPHLELLMRYGCRATTEDLMLALRRQVFELSDVTALVMLLLKAGADPNGVVSSMSIATFLITPLLPLHFAVAKTNLRAVFILLEHGADPYSRDPVTGLSALGWARHVASFPSRERDRVTAKILGLFEDLETCRQTHERTFPELKKELMERMWHPVRLARLGYFDHGRGTQECDDH